MATSSSLDKLGPELHLSICEQLYNIEPPSLSSLRLVSSTLSNRATPFVFREVDLKEDILATPADSSLENVAKLICAHTVHFTIRCKLDWSAVVEFWAKCRRFKILSWKYEGYGINIPRALPKELRNVFDASPELEFRMISYAHDSDFVKATSEIHSFPSANLTAFQGWLLSHYGEKTEGFQRFLTEASRLQTLRLGSYPFSPGRGKLPPVKKLIIPNWPYMLEEADEIWNLSKLEDIQLPWYHLSRFLESVRPQQLCRLKSIRVDDTCWQYSNLHPCLDHTQKLYVSTTELMVKLLQDRQDFEELDIRCLFSLFNMSLLSRQASSLRLLTILDLAGFEGEGLFPTVSLLDLRMIQQSCNNIAKLSIGVNILGDQLTRFLSIISEFRNLYNLTLYIQSKLVYDEDSVDAVDAVARDVDRESAEEILDILLLIKCGKPLSTLRINVGGWTEQPQHKLKCGTYWDKRRSLGICPERLFVFERTFEGKYSIREQLGEWKPWPDTAKDLGA